MDRNLIIYTWGSKKRSKCPVSVDRNYDATIITDYKNNSNIKYLSGLLPQIQSLVKSSNHYKPFVDFIVNDVEQNNFKRISINCKAGMHRSVACAEILKREFYPDAIIHHLELM